MREHKGLKFTDHILEEVREVRKGYKDFHSIYKIYPTILERLNLRVLPVSSFFLPYEDSETPYVTKLRETFVEASTLMSDLSEYEDTKKKLDYSIEAIDKNVLELSKLKKGDWILYKKINEYTYDGYNEDKFYGITMEIPFSNLKIISVIKSENTTRMIIYLKKIIENIYYTQEFHENRDNRERIEIPQMREF